MKKLFIILPFFFAAYNAAGQYFLRGDIKNEKKSALANVRTFVHTSKKIQYTDSYGSFGITGAAKFDSVTFTLEDYEKKTVYVKTDIFQHIVLKAVPSSAKSNKPALVSTVKDAVKLQKYSWNPGNETYMKLAENDFVNTSVFPRTGLSLNVNKASYSNVRRFINWESTVPPDAVRAEELINYFNFRYSEPAPGNVFNAESRLTSCPWNKPEQLLFINVSAKHIDISKAPPGNFVFLIDVSGSMDKPNRLPLLKEAFKMFVKNLRPYDKISIVRYGGTVSIWLQGASGSEKEKILQSIDKLVAFGDTPGESALRIAYKLAAKTFIKNGTNRVVLATDGDFNVGESSDRALEELITTQRQTGVYLTCLGVGMGNYKDSKLQTLAKKGNGNYAYLDDLREAQKVLVKELAQTFYTVAENAVMNVHFNPAYVKQYRLIGFENKKEALADSSALLEGGEVGSGSSIMAIFEIIPTELGAGKNNAEDLAAINIEYGLRDEAKLREIKFSIKNNYVHIDSAETELKFAAAVTMFALKLKQSKYATGIAWKSILTLAKSASDKNDVSRQEFIQLIEKAKRIYEPKKKRFVWFRKLTGKYEESGG